MTLQASAYVITHPSFIEPEIILQYSQASGFTDLFADGKLRVRMAEDDLFVYMKTLNVRTKVAAGTASSNELPGVDISARMISTPSYLFKTRSQYDHHDEAAGGRWGFSTPQAYTLAMRQGNFQLARDAALYGMNPQNGEGLLYAANATSINLPPDTNGNDTVLTYDNGQMAFFLAQEILAIKTRTYHLGIGKKFTIIGPQRTLGSFEYNVVQVTQFQRLGAGTASTAQTLKEIVAANGDEIVWAYDDTLEGKGNGGADAVIIVMPEVSKPMGGEVNTNAFAGITPGASVCTTQYCDMAAPREITAPLADGAVAVTTEWRLTSGWAPRGEAITVVSMTY